MTAFALPASCLVIPPGNLRLSSVAGRLRDILCVGTFAALLRELDPDTFERLRVRQAAPYEYTLHLVRAVSKRFPLDDTQLDDIWNNAMEMDDEDAQRPDYDPDLRAIYDMEHIGIPFEAHGFNLGEYEDRSPATDLLCLAVAWDPSCWGREYLDRVRANFAGVLAQFDVRPPARTVNPDKVRPPRGRAWLSTWSGIADALRWVSSSTGYSFLDSNSEFAWEYGLPEWNMEEIHSLEQQWKESEPILNRVRALIDYVDAAPGERLPVLRGILCGEAGVLRQATYPVSRPKTLCEVFR